MLIPSAKRAIPSSLVVIQLGLFLVAAISRPLQHLLHVPSDRLIYPISILLLLNTGWAIASSILATRRVFEPYLLFFCSATLFNAGQALLEVFRLNPDGILNSNFTADTTLDSLILVALCLTAMHLGALSAYRRGGPFPVDRATADLPPPTTGELRLVGFVFLLFSILPLIIQFRNSILLVLSGGYIALYRQDPTVGFQATAAVLSSFAIPGALFLLAGSRTRALSRRLSLVIVLIYGLLMFFLGSRAVAAMPLIAVSWLWHRAIRPIPRSVLLSLGVLLLLGVFPMVKVTRDLIGVDRLSASAALQSYTTIDNPALFVVSEMGGSMVTVAYTLELVPSVRGFDFGTGYLYSVLTTFPNFFWAVHPTVARGINSVWLVETVEPIWASQGGGLGYSFIAEAYLNFGWFGAPALLALLGYIYAEFEKWSNRRDDPARIAVAACTLAFVLFFPRSESAAVVRPLVWFALAPYLLTTTLRRARSRRRPSLAQVTHPSATHND